MKGALILALVISGFSLGLAQEAVRGKTLLVNSTVDLRVSALFESLENSEAVPQGLNQFPSWLTWSQIPELLQLVDSSKRIDHLLINPLSSQRQTSCTEGMMALWLIEGLRKGGKFPSNNPLCLPSRARSGEWETISEQDHKAAAAAYRAWWKRVKLMPAKQAQQVDPLIGTGLHWH